MAVKSLLLTALVATYHWTPALAAPGPLEVRAGICDSGIYGELAPILRPYPIAQAFCSAYFPVKCTSAALAKRATTTTTTTKATTVTSSTQNAISSAWSKCQQQKASVISTMCSCIESAKPCSTKTSKTTTSTTTSSSPPPSPTCSGPSITSTSGYTYCQSYQGNGMSANFNWGVSQETSGGTDAGNIQQCANLAVGGAGSFRVYYRPADSTYVCQLASGSNCDSNFQPDTTVGNMYVYQRVGTTCS